MNDLLPLIVASSSALRSAPPSSSSCAAHGPSPPRWRPSGPPSRPSWRPCSRPSTGSRSTCAPPRRERARAHADLAAQIRAATTGTESLRTETGRLASALRRTDVRGQWGEMQLRRIVESSGLRAPRALRGAVEHPRRGRTTCCAPTSSCTSPTTGTSSSTPRCRWRRTSRRSRRPTTRPRGGSSPSTPPTSSRTSTSWAPRSTGAATTRSSSSCCSCPPSRCCRSALEVRPDLLQHAFDRDVVLATPTTLLAILRTVAHTWRQEAAARNVARGARARARAARAHRRARHAPGAARRRRSTRAVGAYNATVGSLESRVLVPPGGSPTSGSSARATTTTPACPSPRLLTTATRPLGSPGAGAPDRLPDRPPACRLPTRAPASRTVGPREQ